MFRPALCILLCATASALTADASSNSNVRGGGFVKPLEFKHLLRVCNAYPYNAALDIYRGSSEKLTKMPMHYRKCEDFQAQLRDGDKLEFKVGDATAGTFAVSELPQNDAVLLLVISRHDTESTAVSFMSHIFANLHSAEVVIMDTYKGKVKSTLQISDAAKIGAKVGATLRSEELRFDSVMAVSPGNYEVALKDATGKANGKSKLVALNQESYAIIRVGVEALQGPAFPEELLIFPNSDVAALKGAAATTKVSMALLAVLLGLTAFY